jgi:hypothetical protein
MAEAATQHHGKPTTPKTAKSQNATTLANPVASTPSAQGWWKTGKKKCGCHD